MQAKDRDQQQLREMVSVVYQSVGRCSLVPRPHPQNGASGLKYWTTNQIARSPHMISTWLITGKSQYKSRDAF